MLTEIIKKCREGQNLSDSELRFLLSEREPAQTEKIFEAARAARKALFGKKIFLYGFVYFSTWCRNECNFCYFRKSNGQPERYRKSEEEIVRTAVQLKDSGVHLIDLTMGEDPWYLDNPRRLSELVRRVKAETGLAVMVSPGLIADESICELAQAGADWYALYQETHNPQLFEKMRIHQSYEERMAAKADARKNGMLIEEGLLCGIGDTVDDIVHSLREMGRIGASQMRAMTFVPQAGTPMEKKEVRTDQQELLNIAVMRLLYPDVLIPASLDVEGLYGLEERLMAGANVITSIIPPQKGFAGVANADRDIDNGNRTVDGIRDTVTECGLEIAKAEEYRQWIENRKKSL
ncbi:MAG: methylornithine synthase PylB [Clostridiales bacterium]|nr:methylornithine synthase PylB [Clostridiales bacterium]